MELPAGLEAEGALGSTSMALGAKRATLADLEVRPEKPYAEVVDGVVVEKALPRGEHGHAQATLASLLLPSYQASAGFRGRPGGWWFASECTIEFERHEVYQPDLAGWRRDRAATPPSGYPVRLAPEWVCEILSPSNRRHDTVEKLRVYQRHGIGHYWLLDPEAGTLIVYRNQGDLFAVALAATRAERVRAAPFDAVELSVGELLGDEPDGG